MFAALEEQHTSSAEPAAAPAATQQIADDAPKLSKRQQKRMLKMERQQEYKRARREEKKEDKSKALEAKRAAIDSMLAGMSEAEREQWHQKNKEKRKQSAAERAAAKARQQQALSAPQKLVIDLDFCGLMTAGELKSVCQQVSYSYSTAVNGQQQMHLHLLGLKGDVKAALQRQLPGHVHWSVTQSEQGFKEFFKDRLQDLVYLTADSPNELQVLDESKVYILGGLVDRNRHKGICLQRAQEAGVATARLPIATHFKLHTSAVITVNQCVDILSRMQGAAQQDWRAVLEAVLPSRKKASEDGDSGGSGGKEATPTPAPQAAAAAAEGRPEAREEEGEELAAGVGPSDAAAGPAAAAAAAGEAAEAAEPIEGGSS